MLSQVSTLGLSDEMVELVNDYGMRGDLWKKEVAGSRQQKLQHQLVTNLGWGWLYRTIALYLALVTIRPGLHTYHVTRKKLRHPPHVFPFHECEWETQTRSCLLGAKSALVLIFLLPFIFE